MNARSAPVPVIDPTPRQTEILEFIRQTLTESGAPPTRDEISQAFGFRSLNAAEQHLQALQKKGLIELIAGTSRGIRFSKAILSGEPNAVRRRVMPARSQRLVQPRPVRQDRRHEREPEG